MATNLASTFVAENKKVLLVDANLWRPSLHNMFPRVGAADEVFGGQTEYGLTDLLMGQCTARDVIRTSGIEGFDIIDSGISLEVGHDPENH